MKVLLLHFYHILSHANSMHMTLEDLRTEEFVVSAWRHSLLVFTCCITDKIICIHCTYSLLSCSLLSL